VGAWTNICHNLIFCRVASVFSHDPHPDWLVAQRRVYEIYDQEGIAFLGNIRAVMFFQLVLRLVGTKMHKPITDPT
jgi:hypothetical protein